MDARKLPAQELLRLCLQSQDPAAWQDFVHRFQPLIASVIVKSIRRWTTPTPSLVDDLVQDTYLKLCANNFRALRDFDCQHENALFGFLKVVASNVVHDHFRGSYSQKRGSGRDEDDLDGAQIAGIAGGGFAETAERAILIGEIRQCLEGQAAEPNFTRDCMIFWLYYQQGLTAKAISELPAVSLTVKGVESTLLRLTRLVREKMNARPSRTGTGARPSTSGQAAASGG
jgi:RNA polymerase sigma-70 factor, ECF subfamily